MHLHDMCGAPLRTRTSLQCSTNNCRVGSEASDRTAWALNLSKRIPVMLQECNNYVIHMWRVRSAERMPCPCTWRWRRVDGVKNAIACRETEAINKGESTATSSSRTNNVESFPQINTLPCFPRGSSCVPYTYALV